LPAIMSQRLRPGQRPLTVTAYPAIPRHQGVAAVAAVVT
jgi:hypothetical protein